jgi:hypothetical protein
MRLRLPFAVLLLTLALAGCRDEAPPATTATTPPPAPAPATDDEQARGDALAALAAPPEFAPGAITDTTPVDTTVVDVQLADAGDGKRLTGRHTTTFGIDDPVFLAIRTEGTAARYTLTAKWLDAAGAVLTEYGQDVRTAGPAETQFSLSRPDGWAPGSYTVELAINGKPARTVAFTVK